MAKQQDEAMIVLIRSGAMPARSPSVPLGKHPGISRLLAWALISLGVIVMLITLLV
jgi:hypothetical protein